MVSTARWEIRARLFRGHWGSLVVLVVTAGVLLLMDARVVAAVPVANNNNNNNKNKVQHASPRAEVSCLYNNRTYRAGVRFRPDPCTFCHCTRRGGRPRCAIEDCKYEPSCVRHESSPGTSSSCCPACVERGCLDGEGNVYLPGEVTQHTPCSTCLCPLGGGRIECTRVECRDVSCVNPIRQEGDCCQRCPNGANCWLNGRVIPAGRLYQLGRCKACQCPVTWDPAWEHGGGPKAVCSLDHCVY